MSEYYFFASSLPRLQIGYPPDLSFQEFLTLARENLKSDDLDKVRVIQGLYDIYNIRYFWQERELGPYGRRNEKELEEALFTQVGLPSFVFEFCERFDATEDRIQNFSALLADYFKAEIEKAMGFLKEFLIFEREWRLVLTGFRAKKLSRNLMQELQYEDPYDDVVGQILAQKDAPTYEPPERYSDLKGLFEEHAEDPLALHQSLYEWRFERIREMVGVELFTMDRILGFMVRLILVEKWEALDKSLGIDRVNQLIEEAK